MIFVTIGTQEPFDRLIKAMDELAPYFNGIEIIAQNCRSRYIARNIKILDEVSPLIFEELVSKASLIVAHAGMGTIISALIQEKPLIVMPRMADLGEHRNDHQLATAARFQSQNYLVVAHDKEELRSKIVTVLKEGAKRSHNIGSSASTELLDSIKAFSLV